MQETVFAVQPCWHGDWQAAKATGLDVKRAREQITGRDITAILEQDTAEAKAIGIPQPPTLCAPGHSAMHRVAHGAVVSASTSSRSSSG